MPLSVLLLENIHPVAKADLESLGFEVELLSGSLKEDALAERLKTVNVLGIRSKTQVTARVLESAKNLYAIGAFCIGTNQVELAAASKAGVCVFNAPFSNTRSVAELVMAEVVMLSRQLGDRVREMHAGKWRKVASGSHEVRGKTLGVVGYGHIGTQVGILAEFFGMRVLFYDIAAKLPLGNCRAVPTLEALLEESDFVTLHVPETPQTRNMLGEKQLARMKRGACLLNDARGSVVDLHALALALRSGHLGGAAVDVYPDEPEANSTDDFVTELQGLPNVILTPHIGGSTVEAQEAIGKEVAHSLARFLTTGATTSSVNFPQVELGQALDTYRVANVHQNVPGVMRDVNRIVSDHGANIHAQVLSTSGELGYLVMDLDNPVASQVAKAMRQMPTTLHARALGGA
jgi:D-3-phosphoglycerate dehydrogenase